MRILYCFIVVISLLNLNSFVSPAPVLAAVNPNDIIDFVYYCKPIHYLSTPVQWQRIDSGVKIASSTSSIAYAEIWIENFDPTVDAISMLGSDYVNSLSAVQSGTPGKILIQKFGDAALTIDVWSNQLQLAAYKLEALATADVNLCGSYAGIYTRKFNFQVTDVNNEKSNIYTKNMVVKTAVFIYADVSLKITDKSTVAALQPPDSMDPAISLITAAL